MLESVASGACSPLDALAASEPFCQIAPIELDWALVSAYASWQLCKYQTALDFLERVHIDDKSNITYLAILGMVCKQIDGLYQRAYNAYESALCLDSNRADIHYNFANLCCDVDPLFALEHYSKSLVLDPFNSVYWHNYGTALHSYGFACLARTALKYSIQLDPFYNDAWCNLGIACLSLNCFSPSQSCFDLAVSLDSFHGTLAATPANVLLDVLPIERAFAFSQQSTSLDVSTLNSLWNYSLTLLLDGDYINGWKYYESRFATSDFEVRVPPNLTPCPLDLPVLIDSFQSEIVVWSEQGIGDSIQFCRYLYLLQASNIPFKLHTDPSLVRLFNEWMGFDQFASAASYPNFQPDNRMHISLLSLPRLFRSDLLTIPSFTPYLRASKATPDHLSFNSPPGALSVGIVWATNPNNSKMYRQKSILLSLIMPLLFDLINLDLIELHSLQVGVDSNQLAPWSHCDRIFDWSQKLIDFSDTAHVVDQLDLVISVDTAVAHLAAALNKPVWLLLPYSADFRWLRSRYDSPWYPTMRLFRQDNPSDWKSVLAQLRHSIDQLFGMDIKSLSRDIVST